MTQLDDSDQPGAAANPDHWAQPRNWYRKVVLITTLTVLGGLLFGLQAGHPPQGGAVAPGQLSKAAAALIPPEGTTWIVGTTTDQAAHGQDNVNVEAWPDDPAASAPAASALTYGGQNYSAVAAHGFFRLEVPSGQPYRIVFSAVGNQEDGDPFRMQRYGQGRPIVVRTPSRAAPGRVRDLGMVQLVRQGKVTSRTKADVRSAKVRAGRRGTLRVVVSSRYVTNIKGRVVVRVAGHNLQRRLRVGDHGTLKIKLPTMHHAGKHRVVARFLGTSSVHSSKAKPVTIKVVKKK